MALRTAIITGTLLIMASISIMAADGAQPAGSTADSSSPGIGSARSEELTAPLRPWVSPTLPASVRCRLEAGFELAVSRLQDRPQCRELFARLGADGVDALSTTLYYPADQVLERQLCHKAVAYTMVGAAPTWVCRRIAQLPVSDVALTLVHEALHHAGLGEWPLDRNAPRARTIDNRVRAACGL
jgi:hypothetical protein